MVVSIVYAGVYWGTVAFIGVWVALFFLRKKLQESKVAATSQEVAYNRKRFGAILDWSAKNVIIHGKPVLIIGGEFQYWRVPDKSRWESILRLYKGVGLNCVRVPFHWGYHSPDQGVYHYDGNRDISFLLELCEKLRLYVIAAPGPYIASDTQAGGLPLWLVANKSIRLRHLHTSFWKKWDPDYYAFSKEWLESILALLVPHQITENSHGCIIAIQLENKLVERQLGFPLAIADELKSLAVAARAVGVTVPLLNNDLSDEGSFTSKTNEKGKQGFWSSFFSGPGFSLDLYAITKKVVPAPFLINGTSSSKVDEVVWESWEPSTVAKGIDQTEEKSRVVGATASEMPIVISELQAGWSNCPTSSLTYDDIYTFYGAELTSILLESALSQGSYVTSLYTPYGGTNWGTLGSPETYTSYDHAACIREYGHLSGQYRKLRLSLLFIRSFKGCIVNCERDQMPFTTVSEPDMLNSCRMMTKFLERSGSMYHKRNQDVELVFFRNLNDKECSVFDVQLNLTDELQELEGHDPFFMSCQLPFKQSFIGLGNYTASNGLHLKLSTKPIYARHSFRRQGHEAELWIVQASDSLFSGEMAFEGTVDSRGTLGIDFRVEDQGRITLMTFEEGPGWVALSQGDDKSVLYIVALDVSSLDTLYGAFRDGSWDGTLTAHEETGFFFGWGVYNMELDGENDSLDISYLAQDQELVILLPEYEDSAPPPGFQLSQALLDLPFAFERKLNFPKDLAPVELTAQLLDCEMRQSVFSEWRWQPLELSGRSEPSKSPLELGFSSGHCAYRCYFSTKPCHMPSRPSVSLNLLGSHSFTVFVNGVAIGSHVTLTQKLFRPGTTSGPELWFGERPVAFDLSNDLKYPNPASDAVLNEVVVVVDSLGLNQMALAFDDARNSRGLKYIELNIPPTLIESEPVWKIGGVDARTLTNPYNTSGFPDENILFSGVAEDGWKACTSLADISKGGLVWFRARFRHPLADQRLVVRSTGDDDPELYLTCPLHLLVKGRFNACIFLNGYWIGRYHGNGLTPQDKFYLMDGLLTDDPEADNLLAFAFYPLGSDNDFSVKVAGYRVSLDPVGFSGNLAPASQGGRDLLLAHQSLTLPTAKICPPSELFTPISN